MSLQTEIDETKKQIHADGYPMSIGEFISIYEKKELEIHPAFQRYFRWSPVQKTKLIESILLGIPIPSIFVSQREDGVWDVVDGLQRLSTILEFVGVLRGEDGQLKTPAQLHKTQYLPSLAGKYWESADPATSFTQAQRMALKREKLDFKIIKKESDAKTKFELFQRLNTLGTALTPQEVRNCLLIMLNPDFHKYLSELTVCPNYQTAISLSDRQEEQRYDMELVLRYLAYKLETVETIKAVDDVGEFLTETVKAYAQSAIHNWDREKKDFEATFQLLADAMGDEGFRRYNVEQGRFLGGFLVSAFEAIAVGVGHNIKGWISLKVQPEERHRLLKLKIQQLWSEPAFRDNSGAGINSVARANALIPLGKRFFMP
jgi:hypothetical protein